MIPTTFFSSVNSFHNKVGSWLLLLVFMAGFELPEAIHNPQVRLIQRYPVSIPI